MRKKHSSPAQKKANQQVIFQRKILKSKNIQQASNSCFVMLAKAITENGAKEFLYMFKNFLELPMSKGIMNYRYKKNSMDVFDIKALPLDTLDITTLINWLSEIFCFFNNDLNEFIIANNLIYKNIMLGDFDKAKIKLDDFVNKHGQSNWSIATNLTLLYFQGDINRYKEEIKCFASLGNSLSESFLSYDGIRCNPSITAERYKFSIGKMLEEVRLRNQSHQSYIEETIKYRHDFDPCDIYSSINLFFSKTCEKRIFDMYVSFKRFICYKYNIGENINEFIPFIERIKNNIIDSEIDILHKRILGINDKDGDIKYNEVINEYVKDNCDEVITLSEMLLGDNPNFAVIYLPYVKSLVRKSKNTNLNGPLGEIIKLSCNLFSNTDFDESFKKLSKIYYVLLHKDWIHIIGCLLESFNGSDGINNPQRYNYVDSILLENNKISFRDAKNFEWLNHEAIYEWRKIKLQADKLFYDEKYDQSLKFYEDSLNKSEKSYFDELKAKIIYCNFSLGNKSIAINELSELLQQGVNPRRLPINTIAEYVAKSAQYKTSNQELYNEAIILNAYNKNIINTYIQQLSNICENFLENINITSSNQINFSNKFIPDFMLTDLLSIDILEGMTSIIESELDVLLTRLQIDRYIITNDQLFDDKLINRSRNEITNIFYKLIVQSCSNEAGEGRIYVDKSSIKAKLMNDVEKELKILKDIDDRVFDTHFEMTDSHGIEYRSMSTPFMRDVFDLIIKVSEGYTIDTLYGIDQSLNVGIRHGGIVNLLWAPLKSNGIAAQKSKDNKFVPNSEWRNDFGYYNKAFLDSIDKNLVIFNEKLNTIINAAKENVHINTGEFLDNKKIFNYVIEIEFVEEVAKNIDKLDADTFVELIFNYLDEKTNESLEYAKNVFIPSLRDDMNKAILNVKKDIKIENINRAITQSKNELEESLQFLQSWFNWSGTSKTPFSFNAAIEKAKFVLHKLHPWLDVQIIGDVTLKKTFLGKHFTSIVTLLTLIFDNVVKHGDTKNNAEIMVNIDEKPDLVELKFTNKIQRNFSNDELNKFKEINQILNIEYEKYSAKETGSGVFKIKKILSLELKCKNNMFINIHDNSFTLTIEIHNNCGIFE